MRRMSSNHSDPSDKQPTEWGSCFYTDEEELEKGRSRRSPLRGAPQLSNYLIKTPTQSIHIPNPLNTKNPQFCCPQLIHLINYQECQLIICNLNLGGFLLRYPSRTARLNSSILAFSFLETHLHH